METKAMTKFRGIKFLFIVTEWALIIPLDKSPSMCYSILVRSVCPYYALRKTAWTLSPIFVYEKSYTFTKCMMMTQKKCSIVCLVIWKMFPCWNVIASSRFLSLMTFSFLLWHLDNCLVTMEVFFQTRCHSKRSIVYDCKCISDVYLFAKTCECDRGFLQGLTIQA